MAQAVASTNTPLAQEQLHHWKLLEQFQRHLAPRLAAAGQSAAADHQLTAADYLSLQLFALLNPVLKSARSLCVGTESAAGVAIARARAAIPTRANEVCLRIH